MTNKELYIGGSWKFIALKYSYSIDDYFGLRGWDATGASTGKSTKGTGYLDLSANYDLGDGWGINAHVGRLNLKNGYKGDYTDWKVGVTKDVGGWVFAASYIDTNAAGNCTAPATPGTRIFLTPAASARCSTTSTATPAGSRSR